MTNASGAPTSTGSKAKMPAALAQLDYVLKVNPTNPPAVVTRSYILLKAKQHEQASAILRTAIEL